ncbi:MAG: LOG family protein [Armatimonadetes bacterium]|jgi:uncharacterized protein (TIGR00730 family)|nr:LOG family protein [Armatimonadota bacterium]HOC31908.1 LOG family protein [Armatimonadota bacterium]
MPDPTEFSNETPSRDDLRAQMGRVIEQYLKLDHELRQVENTNFRVCIFGSARIRRSDPAYELVYNVAKRLSEMGMDIVTGGGPGLMEAANRAVTDVHSANSKSYGLPLDIPTLREPANRHLDIKSAHQRFSSRLDEFIRLSHAVIVAPGGIGTLLELSYVWQLLQIRLVEPRPAILLGADYWKGLIDWMRKEMAGRAFVNPEDIDIVQIVNEPDEVVEILAREQETYLRNFHNNHMPFIGTAASQE